MIEYINVIAVVWLTYIILTTAIQINNNIGRSVGGINIVPLLISIGALIALGIATIKELPL